MYPLPSTFDLLFRQLRINVFTLLRALNDKDVVRGISTFFQRLDCAREAKKNGGVWGGRTWERCSCCALESGGSLFDFIEIFQPNVDLSITLFHWPFLKGTYAVLTWRRKNFAFSAKRRKSNLAIAPIMSHMQEFLLCFPCGR